MLSIQIDGLDEETALRLRARAAGNECSMEEEARNVLRFALDQPGMLPQPKRLGTAINELFKDLGIIDVIVPPRWTDEPIRFVFEDDDGDDC